MGRKSRATLAVIALAVILYTQGSGAGAQDVEYRFRRGCSEATLRGSYGVQIQGTRFAPAPAPPGTVESVIGVILRQYDGQGNFTQINNEKGSVAGSGPVDRAGSGTYFVNEDCTGSHELHIPGVPTPIVDKFVVVDFGREVRHFVVTPAPVMVSGVARKMDLW